MGALDDIPLISGDETKQVNLKVPEIFIIGDMQGGDKICCTACHYRLCGKFNVRGDESEGDPLVQCKKINMVRMMQLVKDNRQDILDTMCIFSGKVQQSFLRWPILRQASHLHSALLSTSVLLLLFLFVDLTFFSYMTQSLPLSFASLISFFCINFSIAILTLSHWHGIRVDICCQKVLLPFDWLSTIKDLHKFITGELLGDHMIIGNWGKK
jgi:hypothetical protein